MLCVCVWLVGVWQKARRHTSIRLSSTFQVLFSVYPQRARGWPRRQVRVEGWTYDRVEREGRNDGGGVKEGAPWYQNGNADRQHSFGDL